jgi:hypothetical protein
MDIETGVTTILRDAEAKGRAALSLERQVAGLAPFEGFFQPADAFGGCRDLMVDHSS